MVASTGMSESSHEYVTTRFSEYFIGREHDARKSYSESPRGDQNGGQGELTLLPTAKDIIYNTRTNCGLSRIRFLNTKRRRRAQVEEIVPPASSRRAAFPAEHRAAHRAQAATRCPR